MIPNEQGEVRLYSNEGVAFLSDGGVKDFMTDNNDYKSKITTSEWEVLHLVADGYCNKEIAEKLNSNIESVSNLKISGLQKLNLQNRIELVHFAIKNGWRK